jgi:hypothetical protein
MKAVKSGDLNGKDSETEKATYLVYNIISEHVFYLTDLSNLQNMTCSPTKRWW